MILEYFRQEWSLEIELPATWLQRGSRKVWVRVSQTLVSYICQHMEPSMGTILWEQEEMKVSKKASPKYTEGKALKVEEKMLSI